MSDKSSEAINKENLIAELQQNTYLLIETIAEFPDKKFTNKPEEGKWSASMIAEHLVIVEDLVNKVLEGKTGPAGRDPGLKIGMIDGAFRNLDRQYPAGDAILPREKLNNKDDLIGEIGKNRKHLQKIILNEDLYLLCSDYEHFGFGYMTRLEWVYFNMLHAQRHFHQMERLKG